MDSLTETFNSQAYDNIFLIPLWILLILDAGEKRDRKRKKHIFKLDREFNEKSMKQSRNQYRKQVAAKRCNVRHIRPPTRRR